MRSAARRSPPPRPRSASTTPTSVRSGKWWPLAMIWVPSSTSIGVGLHGLHDRGRGGGVRASVSLVITATRALGSSSASSSARRSTPGPEAVSRPTAPQLGQCSGVGMRIAAMVALQPPAQPVRDQPGRAVRAGEPVAAGAAQGERRVAAAVQEQQRLGASREIAGQRLAQRRRQEAAARRPLAAQVDQPDLGHRRTAMARRQLPPDASRLAPAARRATQPAATADSSDGVAEASTTAQPSSRARARAMSRAW